MWSSFDFIYINNCKYCSDEKNQYALKNINLTICPREKLAIVGAKTLEDTLIQRLDQVDSLLESNEENDSNIKVLSKNMQRTYQKMGLIKYDAFHEMGGKLSFSLAMLDMRNNGFIINAMHTREGCYTYIKEIIDGNSVIVLSEEEQEALKRAMDPNSNLKNSDEE